MKRGHLAAALLVVAALVLCGCTKREVQTAESFDWPCWRGPDGNGISRETDWDPNALAGGPRVLWKANVGYGYSNVGIEAGRLVWGSEAPPVDRLRAELGDDNGATYMTPVLYDAGGKRCALIYSWKGLYSVDTGTGESLWLYEWENYNVGKSPDPLLLGDRILIADEDTSIQGQRFCTLLEIVDALPTVVWKSPNLYSDVTSPIALGGYIYGTYGGPYSISPFASLRCLELESGQLM